MTRFLFPYIIIGVVAFSALAGCGSEAPPMGDAMPQRDSMPVMTTFGVSKLISDSGVMRYKMVAEEWRVFDKTQPPRWEFPRGIFLERYDDKFRVNLHITADTAYLFDQNLWELRGHVTMHDEEASTRLFTEELFWDMRTGELRSDVYSRLMKPDEAIEGNWFRAVIRNNELTQYHVRQTKGFMPMNDYGSEPVASPAPADTLPTDTLPQREAPVSRRRGS